METEHRQQIIDIQREIEQQAIRRREERELNGLNIPPMVINSSTVRKFVHSSIWFECRFLIIFYSNKIGDPVAEYSQQIIDMQREIEQEAIRRRDSSTPHMPPRLINSSTIRKFMF